MLIHFFYCGLMVVGFMNIRFVKPRNLSQDINKYDTKKSKEENNNEKLKLISQSIKNGTKNFSDNTIILKFNKEIFLNKNFIKLQGTSKEKDILDIFKITKKGSTLEIKLKNKTEKNKTYIISFLRKSIFSFTNEDIDDFDIIFSCGDKIDNCKLSGSVYDLLLNEKKSKCYVCLYKLTNDEIKKGISKRHILNCQNPDYFKYCSEGDYIFENIAYGTYFVCAGEIDTNTLTTNKKKHDYGFIKNFITFDSNKVEYENVNIDTLNNDISEYQIDSISFLKNIITVKVNEVIEGYDIEIDKNMAKYFSKFKEKIKLATSIDTNDDKQIIIENSKLGLISNDILPCVLTIKNKFGEEIKKKIEIKFNNSAENNQYTESSNQSNENIKVLQISKDNTINSLADFKIIPEKKIISLAVDKINVYITDENFRVKKKIKDFEISKDQSVIYLKTKKSIVDLLNNLENLTESEKRKLNKNNIYVNIHFSKDALRYDDHTTNKETTELVLFVRNYSSIPVEIDLKSNNCKLELLDKNTMLLKAEKYCSLNNKNITFNNVPYGKYIIRYFTWNGKKWNKGNIYRNEEHDKVGFYTEDINIFNKNQYKKIKICE